MTDSAEWPRGRRFPKAVRYSVEMEYSRPLGWISRAADGKFVLRNNHIDEEVPDAHFIPSSHHPGIRGSIRSEGSGQSLYVLSRSPPTSFHSKTSSARYPAQQVSFSLASQPIPSVYSPPRDLRIRTSSPGPVFGNTFILAEDLSSVNQPSSAERSFPSTVSSHFASGSALPSSYVELPAARALHNPSFYNRSRQFRPIRQVQADVHAHSAEAGPQTPRRPPEYPGTSLRRPQLRVGPDSRVWRDGRHIHLPGHHPTRRLEVPRVSAIQKAAMSPRQLEVYNRLQVNEPILGGWNEGPRPLATSSPPRLDRRVARVPPSLATKTETTPKSTEEGSDEASSSEHPMTYTRDRLLGAVERVRSSALHRGGPFRHSAPELAATARERFTCATPEEIRAPPSPTVEATDNDPLRVLEPSRSRASITSGSSGRGSSGQGSKVSHSRGDSLQGELLDSSSGFLSRNSSNTTASRHGGGALVRTSPEQQQDKGELDLPANRTSHHDISVDENYEFDSVSPFDAEMFDPRRQYAVESAGLSDSELYGGLYPRPQKRSQYDNTEARCAALKQEFLRFRQQQKKEVLESAC